MNFGLSNVKLSTLDGKEIQSVSDVKMKTESDQDFDYSFLNQSEELSASIETDLSVDLFSYLEKSASETNFILRCDYGTGEDNQKYFYFNGKLKHEITNIKKIRKGKRWIRKFNYTGNILMDGVSIR